MSKESLIKRPLYRSLSVDNLNRYNGQCDITTMMLSEDFEDKTFINSDDCSVEKGTTKINDKLENQKKQLNVNDDELENKKKQLKLNLLSDNTLILLCTII